jgi:hypothetical protein
MLTGTALLDLGMTMMRGRTRIVLWLKPHKSQCDVSFALQPGGPHM